MWISPLAVLWGITKVNCSFTGTGEVTPATPNPPLPPSPLSVTSSVPSDSSFPLASSLYCTNASSHWWPHLGVVCVTSPSLSRCARTKPIQRMQTNSTTSVLHRHRKHRKHVPTCSQACVRRSGVMRGRLSDNVDTGFTSSLFGVLQIAPLYGWKIIIYCICTKIYSYGNPNL